MLKRLRCKFRYVFFISFFFFGLYFFGFITMLQETDYKDFRYPLDMDIVSAVQNLRVGGSAEVLPINDYNFSYLSDCKEKCLFNEVSTHRVVYLVKSAVNNFEKRQVIRKTWGFEKRFSDVPIRTVFILGTTEDAEMQKNVHLEQAEYRDIVQASFHDSYYNNTIKTMMAFKWVVKHCANSKFYLFVDDDYYVSTKNLLKFVRNPLEYPAYLNTPILSLEGKITDRLLKQVIDIELPDDAELFSGFMFPNSRPQRFIYSKWYVSLGEYPYSRYPPYVTAGAYILSKQALLNMYYASFFTKHFRFDDIYIAILAKKVNIEPLHCPEFYFSRKSGGTPLDYKYVVASHGFSDPLELTTFWDTQKMAGNA